jgi:hypothetical protein
MTQTRSVFSGFKTEMNCLPSLADEVKDISGERVRSLADLHGAYDTSPLH